MVVQHNINAMTAYNKLNVNVTGLKKSSEKLASGYRINRAGDDAAGLAISEKMRSQIKGLNQAVRNSQDGINMIQTFEGAATNTHEILQRMKVLAEESANGTYDNATDRAALQLEFDQLNEELNQIADTDFNGTVALNGGEMADGLKQIDGEFNYANKAEQLIAKAKEMAQADLDQATAAYNKADAAFVATKYDLSENGVAGEWNTVDNNLYTKEAADTLWKALGLTDADDNVDLTKGTSVDVTFEYDGSAWTVKSATSNKTGAIADDKLTAFGAPEIVANDDDEKTGVGGFKFQAGGIDIPVVFDATNVKKGDTVTLTFTNSQATTHAPTHVAWKADSAESTIADVNAADKLKVSMENGKVTDADILADKNLADVLNGLDNLEFEFTYDGDKSPASVKIGDTTYDLGVVVNTNVAFQLKDAEGNALKDADGNDMWVNVAFAAGKITFATSTDEGKTADKVIFELTMDDLDADSTGTLKGNIALDTAIYAGATAEPSIKAGDDPNLSTSNVAKAARDKAAEALDKATLAQQSIKDLATAKEYLGTKNVSVSDAFDNSTARMTYTDHVVLQTGARTKDAVDFTFKYNTDGTADMGTLKANLNISAREDGLNTESLSVADQKSANYAIDQIDKAINKVSMVRATFGSIQNRLEYKIDNLTTTSTNLQEAESNIRDTDMAQEMMNYTKYSILQQAAQSMLAQANQQPQSILQLLG